VSLKRILTYAVIAFVIWWALNYHADAAQLVRNIGTFLTTYANGISRFVTSI